MKHAGSIISPTVAQLVTVMCMANATCLGFSQHPQTYCTNKPYWSPHPPRNPPECLTRKHKRSHQELKAMLTKNTRFPGTGPHLIVVLIDQTLTVFSSDDKFRIPNSGLGDFQYRQNSWHMKQIRGKLSKFLKPWSSCHVGFSTLPCLPVWGLK